MKTETPMNKAIRLAVEAAEMRLRSRADPINDYGYRLVASARSEASAVALASAITPAGFGPHNDLDPDDHAEAAA